MLGANAAPLSSFHDCEKKAVKIGGRACQTGFQDGETVSPQFIFKSSAGNHAARGARHHHRSGFVIPPLQSESSRNIGLKFSLSVPHRADERDPVGFQMVTDEAVKAVPILVKDQHMDHGHSVDAIESLLKRRRQAIQR